MRDYLTSDQVLCLYKVYVFNTCAGTTQGMLDPDSASVLKKSGALPKVAASQRPTNVSAQELSATH